MQRLIVFLLIVWLCPTAAYCQFLKKKINRYDEDGQRTGLWKEYTDKEETLLLSKFYYLEGRETKVCKHYYQNGNVRLKFKYCKDRIKVKYFYKDGKLEKKGWAKIEYNTEDIHYFWEGEWQFFANPRKLIYREQYLLGEKVQE